MLSHVISSQTPPPLQVTATCLSVVSYGHSPHQNQRRESRLLSPPPSSSSYPPPGGLGGGVALSGGGGEQRPSQETSSLPQLEVVSEEDRESNLFEPLSRGSGRNSSPRELSGKMVAASTPPLRGSRGSGDGGSYSRQLSSQHFLQRQMSSDELALKRTSPGGYSMDDDPPVCEVWVASSNARHSTITVIDYAQRFTNIEVNYVSIFTDGAVFLIGAHPRMWRWGIPLC